MLEYRSQDPVLTIAQDNAKKAISLRGANKQAADLLGFSEKDLDGPALSTLLPKRISDLLGEYVEYTADGNDVGNVLAKVQSFCVCDKSGKEHAMRLKVIRSESLDGNAYFKLILQQNTVNRRAEAWRGLLRENFKGHEVIDPATGLPDRKSIAKDLELTAFYVHKGELNASFAMLELEGQAELAKAHGKEACYDMLKHIAQLARQNLRGDDTLGAVSDKRICIILMDTNAESARMVLNRLRWLVAANNFTLPNKDQIALTIRISYGVLGKGNEKQLLENLEQFMDTQPAQTALSEMAA